MSKKTPYQNITDFNIDDNRSWHCWDFYCFLNEDIKLMSYLNHSPLSDDQKAVIFWESIGQAKQGKCPYTPYCARFERSLNKHGIQLELF